MKTVFILLLLQINIAHAKEVKYEDAALSPGAQSAPSCGEQAAQAYYDEKEKNVHCQGDQTMSKLCLDACDLAYDTILNACD